MSKTITKLDLVNYLYKDLGFNKSESKELVEAFFEEIKSSLVRNEEVKLSGFGNFELIAKGRRPGRNPKTGKEIPIKARRVVKFHSSQKLKTSVEEKSPGKQT